MRPVVVSPAPNDLFEQLGPLERAYAEGIIAPGHLPTIERCWYEDPLSGITDLSTDMDRRFKEGIEGRFMAPIQHLSDSVPEMDGARYRGTRSLPRALSVPLLYVADDTVSARDVLRRLSRGINPKKRRNGLPATGKLYVVTEDGLARYINCLHEQGLDSNTEPTTNQATYLYTNVRSVVPVFRAFDPYWYDITPLAIPIEQTKSTATFFPAPPWRIGPSTVYAAWTQKNAGDVETWPVWTINGPGMELRLVNETTDDYFSLDLDIALGQTVTIDTRPGHKTVTSDAGRNLYRFIDGDLWSLDIDDNDLRVELINTTDASAVWLTIKEGFQSV